MLRLAHKQGAGLMSQCFTMTIERFAAVTGAGRNTVYSAARRGELPVPVIKVGRRLVIPIHAVADLLGVSVAELETQQ